MERSSAAIAEAGVLRWIARDGIDGLALLASAASAEAVDNLGHRQFVIDDGGERPSFGFHELGERLGLRESARETIENESAMTAEAAGAFAHHLPDSGVGDEGTAAHVVASNSHGRRGLTIALRRCAKDIACGQVAGLQPQVKKVGLRAFSHAGCAQKDESPRVLDFRLTEQGDVGPCSHALRETLGLLMGIPRGTADSAAESK